MLSSTIRVSSADLAELRRLCIAHAPNEGGAFALAGYSKTSRGGTLLVRRAVAIPNEEFRSQETHFLEVSPRAISGLASLCRANGLTAILCHSHPDDIEYSPTDDFGEARVASALKHALPPGVPVGSLLFLPGGELRARLWVPGSERPEPVKEVVSVGHRVLHLSTTAGNLAPAPKCDELFDRAVRAFGKEGHALIRRARVAIVGVSGTGTPTAEQLVRNGVSDFVLIDPKVFRPPNLSRMYGTFEEHLEGEQPKVEIVAAHLRRVCRDIRMQTFQESVVHDHVARSLRDRDCVFLCTDDHWGRSVVNQLAYQYLIPTLNVGARITHKNGSTSAVVGVLDVLRPDGPCLWCNGFLSSERIAAESMPARARIARETEGYVDFAGFVAPSVIQLNTVIAAQACSLFFHLMTGFMGEFGDVTRINYDALRGTMRRGRTQVVADCLCGKQKGFGDLSPLATLRDTSGMRTSHGRGPRPMTAP